MLMTFSLHSCGISSKVNAPVVFDCTIPVSSQMQTATLQCFVAVVWANGKGSLSTCKNLCLISYY